MREEFRTPRFLRSMSIDWSQIDENSYLRRIPAISGLEDFEFPSAITLLCGENGSGKSTFLEAVAVAYGFNAEGGTKNYQFSTFQEKSELADAMRLSRGSKRVETSYFFRAESFFNLATVAELKYDHYNKQGKTYHSQSHGESFLEFLTGYSGTGIYLMDEPEAALSPQNQLALLIHVHDMAMTGSQFVIATHSPILLGIPDATILRFDETGISECAYEETESVQITRMFLDDRERMLARLFDDQPADYFDD